MGAVLTTGSVFLHVPKTGGNWIIEVLKIHDILKRESRNKHSTPDRLQVMDSGVFALDPFVFAFVRHPVSWYESWYRYQKKRKFKGWGKNGAKIYHPCSVIDSCQDEDFNQFIANVIEKCPGFVTSMYHMYTKNCSFVGQQEKLFDDMMKVLKEIGIHGKEHEVKKIGKVNVSKDCSVEWDLNLKVRVQTLELPGIIRYGYEIID